MIAPFSVLHGSRSDLPKGAEWPLPSASYPTELLRHTESLVLLHTDPNPASPTSVVHEQKETDVVLTQVRLMLPPPPEPPEPAVEGVEGVGEGQEDGEPLRCEPPRYEARLSSGDGDVKENFPSVPIELSATGEATTVRPLKGRQREDLRLEISELGAAEGSVLWTSAPLLTLGVAPYPGATPSGKLLPVDADAEEGAEEQSAQRALEPSATAPTDADGTPLPASFTSCSWRLQRALPPITKFRTRPMALSYSAGADRIQFEKRLNMWRRELHENRSTAPPEVRMHTLDGPWRPMSPSARTVPTSPSHWQKPWRPPYTPNHLLGDPLTRRQHAKYAADAEADAERFRAQAVVVQLENYYGALPICATAYQACGALERLDGFLQAGDGENLRQIDARKLLRRIKGLRLPFERLVRNVWTAGPEVEYDKAKAALLRLLQREVAARKAAGKAAEAAQPDVEPKQISPMIRAEMGSLHFKPPQLPTKVRRGEPPPPTGPAYQGTKLGRVGLLTFYGK